MRSPAFRRFLAAHPPTVKARIGIDTSTKRSSQSSASQIFARARPSRTLHHVQRSEVSDIRALSIKVLISHRRYLFAIIYIEWPTRFNPAGMARVFGRLRFFTRLYLSPLPPTIPASRSSRKIARSRVSIFTSEQQAERSLDCSVLFANPCSTNEHFMQIHLTSREPREFGIEAQSRASRRAGTGGRMGNR